MKMKPKKITYEIDLPKPIKIGYFTIKGMIVELSFPMPKPGYTFVKKGGGKA